MKTTFDQVQYFMDVVLYTKEQHNEALSCLFNVRKHMTQQVLKSNNEPCWGGRVKVLEMMIKIHQNLSSDVKSQQSDMVYV